MRPEMPRSAPLVLVYVGKRTGMPDEFNHFHAGAAAQNVYLFCTAEGLSTVVCGGFDKKKMAEVMKLDGEHSVLYTQPVGFPAD